MLFSCLVLACVASWADTGQTVTVDGTVVGKFVTGLTFSGDDVVLTFEGGSTQTADMSLVSIDLTYDEEGGGAPSAITEVKGGDERITRIYTLSGQYAGNDAGRLPRGLYIVNGKKVIIK